MISKRPLFAPLLRVPLGYAARRWDRSRERKTSRLLRKGQGKPFRSVRFHTSPLGARSAFVGSATHNSGADVLQDYWVRCPRPNGLGTRRD